ncbi:MAG TPA: DNA mismatch repair endonuclease MutL [Ktedonobacterales bacterium]|nr:DNA mismatch repair endonuclease MutL [Ktedonobacterales bacterium]
MSIRLLPTEVAAKIAAGEVVERPASVVKELLENAIDAGATTIRVDLQEGGLRLIRVSDNGRGMAADELVLALARHATSKIQALDDLERIQTLGFRGEALASVAAVSQLTLTSRPAESEIAATISADNGALDQVSKAGAPVGTTVIVRDLFASVPARLKFLKSRATETGHCLHLLQQYALAYPEVRFQVFSEGRQVFSTAGDGKLFSVLIAVYGLEIADQMIEARSAEREPADNAPPPPRVSGYISRPGCYKSSRQYLSFFVNRRWVQSRMLSFAVEEAYHSLLLAGRHPIAVLDIRLDPALLDVNVHPAKTEVKFLRERQVYATVQRTVRAALLEIAEAPEIDARALSTPAWPGAGVPDEPDDAARAAEPSSEIPGEATPGAPPAQPTFAQGPLWGTLPRNWPGAGAQGAAENAETRFPQAPGAGVGTPWERGERVKGSAAGFRLPGAHEQFQTTGRLPALRVLGQLDQKIIVTEGPDGLYLIDQHAAHERVLLEEMVASLKARAATAQLLLSPLPLECAPREREAIEDRLEALSAIGFDLEPFGPATLLVRAVPGPLAKQARADDLRELLLELAGYREVSGGHSETWEEHALANVACKAAIKAGDSLAPEEMRALIGQLEQVDARYSCCHGRPTMVHLSLAALDRQFDRR